jgi:acetylornithine deacetylase/succinyl-diaminopimelate desuccinylase-like protein
MFTVRCVRNGKEVRRAETLTWNRVIASLYYKTTSVNRRLALDEMTDQCSEDGGVPMFAADARNHDGYFTKERSRHLDELFTFLRIPSVGADPDRRTEMVRAADWVAMQLRRAGLAATEVIPTAGHPVVWAATPAPDPTAPTVLIYGHYDTQPAGQDDGWTSPPFEPTIRDNRLYARGASDDKGNLLIPVKAAEAFHATGTPLPVGLIFVIEGEEESGSPNFPAFLDQYRERLHADVAISADSAMWGHDMPSLMLASRGSVSLQLDARGPNSDLHSGLHGGFAPNPLVGLANVIASMVSAEGVIAVNGFYDDVRTPTPSERAEIAAVPFDEAAYCQSLGINMVVGEPGYGPLERNWLRPTLDVNGLWGGYQGAGGKAVIASEAHAKISCRLVPDQDPAHIISAIERHVRAHCPPGITVAVRPRGSGTRAYAIDPHHPALRAARDALRRSYGYDPLMIRIGATLPFASFFKAKLGIDTVGLAWEMPDENLHGVDEFLRLENFDRGLRVYADLFEHLGSSLRKGWGERYAERH